MLRRKILFLLLVLILALAACGGEEEPTPTPEPPPQPTATPDITANFVETKSEALGVAIKHPAGWVSEVEESGEIRVASSTELLDDPDSSIEGAIVAILSIEREFLSFLTEEEDADTDDPIVVLNIFAGLLTEEADEDEEFTVREAAKAATFNGNAGALAVYDVTSDEKSGIMQLAVINHGDLAVMVVAAVTESKVDEMEPILEAMLDTITLTEPVAAEAPEAAPEPVEEVVEEVVEEAAEEVAEEPAGEAAVAPINQWASDAVASTQYTDDNWSALQTTGEPDTAECGDIVTAWASSSGDTVDWLEVYYDTPVYATGINIYQTYNPDQVAQVELIDMNGDIVPLYAQEPAAVAEPCPYVLSIEVEETDFLVQGVRVTIDQSVLGLGWNEIDAVELVGVPGEAAAAEPTQPVGDAGELPMLFPDLPTPELASGWTMYSNANYVFDVAYYDGLVWGATGGGMVAWEPVSGELVRKWTTLDGIAHNVAEAITVCPLPEMRVVLGTDAGLSLYDPATDAWENWTGDNSGMSSSSGIDSLTCVPHMQSLVIGYDLDGVEVYNAGTGEWRYYDPFEELESSFALATAVVGDMDEIWVAHIAAVSVIRADGSISYYDDDNSNLDDPNTDGFEHFVNDIAVDANGTVWFGQGNGLTRVDGDNQFTFFPGDDIPGFPFFSSVEGLALGPDGALWTNSGFGGVCLFDPATASCQTTYEDEPGMAGRFNSTIVVDENGNAYYASEGEGISTFDGSAWQQLLIDERPEANTYRAIAQGADGSIWVGGFYGGQRFFAYDADAPWEDLDDELGFADVNTFYPRPDGMWVGHSSGASFYEYASGAWTHLERADEAGAGIYKGGVTSMAIDSAGRIWFGTSNGVTVWDGKTFTFYDLLNDEERADERSPRYVYSLLADGDNVWVGGSGAFFGFDGAGEMTRFDDSNSDLGFFPAIYAAAHDADGNVLLGVDRKLIQFDREGSFDTLLEADRNVRSIFLAEDGSLWLATDGGGVLYSTAGGWNALGTADGLPATMFSGGQSVLVDYLGTVWFAASEGGIARWTP